jgi:hypothetical protein
MGAQRREEEMEEEVALSSSNKRQAWWTCNLCTEMLVNWLLLLPDAGELSGIKVHLYALQDLVNSHKHEQP